MSLITITHSLGSRGTAIAQKLATTLDLKLYDDAALAQIALESGMRGKELMGIGENPPGFFARFLSVNPTAYVDLMESVIYHVSRQGNGIILGHGSQILLKEFDCAFHVRIHASEKVRAQELARRQQLQPIAAAKMLEKADNRQKGFFKFAFSLDWNDASLYDLIVNTAKLGVDTAAALIANASNSGDFETCSLNALNAMDNLSLEKKVHAAIIKQNVEMEYLNIEVPEKGSVHITGLVSSTNDKDSIQSALEAIPDATDVHIDVSTLSVHY